MIMKIMHFKLKTRIRNRGAELKKKNKKVVTTAANKSSDPFSDCLVPENINDRFGGAL